MATAKEEIQEEVKEEEKAKQLPKPVGYKMVLAMIEPQQKTEGGIWKPDQLVDLEKSASVCGMVLKTGPDCYADKDRFVAPWCKEGDIVLTGAYKGTRFAIHGQEFRVINDDEVLAVVDDPRGYGRF